MNRIELIDENGFAPEGFLALAEQVAQACAEEEGVGAFCVALTLVDGETIRRVNRETRGVDRETDVLSFPEIAYPKGKTAKDVPARLRRAYDPERGAAHLGDIVLNLFRAREQAEEYGHSVTREMGYLTAHAIFHLMGYDHMEEEDKRTMRAMEKRAMRRLGLYKEEERDMTDMEMKALAIDALKLSYVPYSKYHVGACLLAVDGRTFQGANFENASYGATICAERCAVSNAIAHGVHRFTAIFIATEHDLAWPCGICRQVLNEFKAGDMRVVIGNTDGKWVEKNLSQLLPESFGPENLGVAPEEIRARVDWALEKVGMTAFRRTAPSMLSGGQKQRVAIAGVIAMKPEIIVFDESTSMLDPAGRLEVMETAKALNRENGVTVVWITHFMDEAAQASRLIVVDDGEIRLDGAPRQVFSRVKEIQSYGLEAPDMTVLAAMLRERGLNVSGEILTVEEMEVELCRLRSSI